MADDYRPRDRLQVEFGILLRAARLAADVPLVILAERLDVTPPYVMHVEQGRRGITLAQVERIAGALPVDVTIVRRDELERGRAYKAERDAAPAKIAHLIATWRGLTSDQGWEVNTISSDLANALDALDGPSGGVGPMADREASEPIGYSVTVDTETGKITTAPWHGRHATAEAVTAATKAERALARETALAEVIRGRLAHNHDTARSVARAVLASDEIADLIAEAKYEARAEVGHEVAAIIGDALRERPDA